MRSGHEERRQARGKVRGRVTPWRSVELTHWPSGQRPRGEAALARALVAWRDSKRSSRATADGHAVRPSEVDWTGVDSVIAQNRGAPRTAPKQGVVSLTLGDEYRDKLQALADLHWDGNRSEAVRGLLDWAVEEDRELAERLATK